MTTATRVDKLFSALTAKERALMVLRAWKDGGEEDRQVRSTTPNSQVAEFNRLIEVMNGVNQWLGPYLLLLRANVEQLGLLDGWLMTMLFWSDTAAELGIYIFRHVPEPITETEHKKLKKGRREPRPDWGLRYEVFPDEQADRVHKLRDERTRARETIRQAPLAPLLEGDREGEAHSERGDRMWGVLVPGLKRRLLQYWADMRAIEIVFAQAVEEFDGEDPAIPEVRAILAWMRPELIELHKKLGTVYGEKFELPEPDDLMVEAIRRIARWPEQRTDLSDSDLIRHMTVNLPEREGDR